jgi:hypothetical protein
MNVAPVMPKVEHLERVLNNSNVVGGQRTGSIVKH